MSVAKIHYYLIPGMGANERLFTHFELKYGEVHKLNWWEHGESKNLSDYAKIMASAITTENNVLIGSSMGGMVAVEMAKLMRPLATILISAPTGRHEFPRILKWVNALRIHRAIKPRQVMKISSLANLFMGFKTPEQKALFYEMMQTNGPEFLHFSIGAVLGWKNREMPPGTYIQILGSTDKLFSKRKIRNPIIIEGSGHFTAFEKGIEVSKIVNAFVEEKILPQLQRF